MIHTSVQGAAVTMHPVYIGNVLHIHKSTLAKICAQYRK